MILLNAIITFTFIMVENKESSCGSWSWTKFRYYDKCQYLGPSKPTYWAKTWQEKTDHLMKLINEDRRIGKKVAISGKALILFSCFKSIS